MDNFNIAEIEENFKRGVLEMIILRSLCKTDMYGYEMTEIINKNSEGKINIKEGSLYGPLYRLIDKKCISENKVLVGKRRTRIYFHIEEKGREYLDILTDTYMRMNEGVMILLSKQESGNEQNCEQCS